jgi:hypothetical protein
MGEKIYHWGFLSSISTANKELYLETTKTDDEIFFITSDGTQRQVNSLTLFAINSDLIVEINPGYCVSIKAGTSLSLDYLYIKSIKILGAALQQYRFYACFY